jgi:hypothetical protein
MGVEVVEADEPIRAKLTRLREALWPGGQAPASDAGWLIPHAADSAFAAMNRLLTERKEIFWLREGIDGGPPGDIFVPAGSVDREAMTRLSSDLHVPLRALEAPPEGRAYRVRGARIGLYKPWVPSMDEGWTRWLLEQHGFPFVNLSNEEIRKGEFRSRVDVLLLPDIGKSILAKGEPPPERRRWFRPLPPGYSGGLGDEGAEQIRKWVREEGGTVVALDSSTAYLIDILDLPVANVLEKVKRERFYAPGSMLRIRMDNTLPVAYGMREEEAAYFAGSPAFRTRLPDSRFSRRVIASYPEHDDEILVSGYLRGAAMLERRAAAVEIQVLEGRVILIGFRPQHRAQPHRTFKLLFNALHLPGLEEVDLPPASSRR